MADVRCPMCGKPNPAERDTCQYCDARLKPLIAGQSAEPQSAAPQGDSPTSGQNEPSDWLSGLRSGGQDDFSQEDSASSDDLGAGDWLARLSGSEPERPTDEYGEEIEENTLPDWFTEADTGSGSGQEAKNIYHSEELPAEDWFAASTGDESTEPALDSSTESAPDEVSQPEQESGLFPAEELPPGAEIPEQDSFASISEEDTTEDWPSEQADQQPWESEAGEPEADVFPEQEPAGEPAPSLDWFTAGPGEPSQFDQPAEQAGETVPAEEFDSGTAGSSELSQPAFDDEKEALNDWSTDSDDRRLPAWLTSDRPEISAPGKPTEQQEGPDGEPDWLARVRARQQAEQQTKDLSGEMEEEEQAAPELPDWLSSFSSTEPAGPEAETPAPTEFQTPPVVSPFTNLEDEGQQAFAWSSGGLGQPAQPGQTPAVRKEFDDTPDWLKKLHEEQEEAEAGPEPAFPGEEMAPDWLSNLGAPPTPTTGGSVPAFVLEEGEELSGEEPELFQPSAEEGSLESVPDWLAQMRAEEGEPAAPATEAEPGEELERASLPTWLEAMRPVEAVAPEMFKDTSDSRVENAGPLAGLRGALPAELDLKETHKPPPYSLKMTIPEDQVARLDLLKGLLAEETEPRPLPSPPALSSQFFLRLVVFVVFLVAALYTLWAGPQAATQLSSAQAPQQVVDFQSRLASIQPGTPVLVAVDFEPGYTTELEASLQAVFNQLANRNSPIFTVSTSTSGAIQAERLLVKMNTQPTRQQAPYTGMINLGYLPGGPAGLLTFAADPAHTIPVDIQGSHPWVEVSLEGQAGLASFAAVIVATDRAETARTWIEQIGPGLQQNGVSLLMVTSAQVEPLVRPYYSAEPQLVSGFISGLMGGAAYENLVGQPGAASSALDAFSGVLLVGLAAILIGGLVSLLIGSAPQQPDTNPTIEEKA